MKTLIETRTHTATNLYTYIKNLGQVENLRRQIAHKEEDLAALEQLNEIYKRIGCTGMLEHSQKRASTLVVEILLLTLDKRRLEEQLLEFETAARLED